MKNKFTLIELLIVIAIIGILLTLLMPSLDKARDKSRMVVCMSQLKQQNVPLYAYSANNGGKFPLNHRFSRTIAWGYDDFLAGYDGRDSLTQNQIDLMYLSNADNTLYLCPTDTTEGRDGAAKRSYAPNYYLEGNSTYVGVMGNIKRYVSEINKTSEVISLSERLNGVQRMGFWGNVNGFSQFNVYSLNSDTDPIPHGSEANYLFVDGHVKTLKYPETLDGDMSHASTLDFTGTMWDANKD
ncbi:MAG: prepilin-type N-terminal cleavage/methylation domain-containing protein [Lentisphaeraceae bacterium]|nr:prepilin-type N-terminal cleavage/methylation domain-containing protein [Lentisphaeraceae bacterium]